MMHEPVIKIFGSSEELATGFAREFANWLIARTETREKVHVALSGGSTPILFFREFVALRPLVDWSKVNFFWVDERCVPPDDPESNFGVAEQEFFKPLGIPHSSYHRMRGEEEPAKEALRYEQLVREKLDTPEGVPVFDRILLGMGSDGHTASIFPGQLERWNLQKVCIPGDHPGTGQRRLTLTGAVIQAAHIVSFLVSGEEKATVLQKVINAQGDYTKYPASYAKPKEGLLEWYIDQDAASGLL